MNRLRRLLVMAIILALPLAGASPAAAQSANTADNPIGSGLEQAYRMIFGGTSSSAAANPPASPAKTPTNSTTADSSRKIYAALGDSVAAGDGLPGKSKPVGNDTLCGRSSQAYAYTVAKDAGLPLLFVPCSRATAGDLVTGQGVPGKNITAQLTQAYRSGTPQLITITAGANDIYWADFIRACYARDCTASGYTTAVDTALLALQAKLHYAFQAIQSKSTGTPPRVIITGYYNPLSANCSNYQSKLTVAELRWLEATTAALNQTIADTASNYSFVTFAPLDFSGHDICSSSPWVQGLQDPAPFHPTATGQRQIARAVISSIDRSANK